MQNRILVPALALGLALSANAFGQSWTRSTATDSTTGANTYNPNTYSNEKARAQQPQERHQQSAVTSPQAGSAKMNQPSIQGRANLPSKSAKMNPSSTRSRAPTANWKAEEGD